MHHTSISHPGRQIVPCTRKLNRALRTVSAISLCAFLLGLTGCIVPLADKVTQGHRYSTEALAFLDAPGTTRDEVIASLGLPLLEHESRTLLYEWEQTPQYLASLPTLNHGHNEVRTKVYEGHAEMYGLFIAYDAHGLVEAHEVRKIRGPTLEEACVGWQKRREGRLRILSSTTDTNYPAGALGSRGR